MTDEQTEQRGILWLTFPDQRPPVNPQHEVVARHFHVTLQHGVTEAEFAEFIGREVEVLFEENCIGTHIQACTVMIQDSEVDALCRNENPHCTISMERGWRPVESNAMLQSGEYECFNLDFLSEAVVEWVPFN